MKLNKITLSLAALAATIALVSIYFSRQSSEPTQLAETISGPRPETSAATRFDLQTSAGALTEQEQALLAELQQDFGPDELKRVFNPLTFDEWQQASYGDGAFDHLASASRDFDRYWAEFVDSLDLSPEDAQRVRDIWTESTARKTELGAMSADGSHDGSDIGAAIAEVNNQLLSRLSEILSPEQMTTFLDHEEQLILDTLAFAEAYREELLDSGYSGLIRAAGDDDLLSVQTYLASGADPNRLTTDGRSAVYEAATSSDPEILRVLIDAGADVNQTALDGWSPLMEAVIFGSTDAVRMLADAGANPNHRLDPGNPLSVPLTSAAHNGHTEIVRILLNAGADVTGTVGEFALQNAIKFGDNEMEQMLIEAGANADARRVEDSRILISLGRRLGLVND